MAAKKKKTTNKEPTTNTDHETRKRKKREGEPIQKGRVEGKNGKGREEQSQPVRKEEEAVSRVPFFSTIPEERIAKAARSWVGTPYLNQHAMKGRGADCLRFFVAFYREFGLLENAKIPHYNIHGPVGPNLDTLSAELAKHQQFVVDETKGIVDGNKLRPKPGTLLALSLRSFLHTGVVLASWRHGFIHVFPHRPCKIEPHNDYWRAKIVKAWVPMKEIK